VPALVVVSVNVALPAAVGIEVTRELRVAVAGEP
jgi:hypothetical protein